MKSSKSKTWIFPQAGQQYFLGTFAGHNDVKMLIPRVAVNQHETWRGTNRGIVEQHLNSQDAVRKCCLGIPQTVTRRDIKSGLE